MRIIYTLYRRVTMLRMAILAIVILGSISSRAESPIYQMDSLSESESMDVMDIMRKLLHIHPTARYLHKNAPDALGPFFSGFAFPTYSVTTGLAASATINLSFRTQRNSHITPSYINNILQYTQYNQIIFQSISNFYTPNNTWQFPGDIRFYRFPTVTYGLGSNSLPSAYDTINYSHIRFYRSALRKVVTNTYIGLGYNLDYRWNITDGVTEAGGKTDFAKYGYKSQTTSSGLSVEFVHDSRNDLNTALSGTYLAIKFTAFNKVFGSTSNWNSLVIDLRKYIPLSRKWYTELALWSYTWINTNGKPPYLDLPSIGWDAMNNTGREYAIGRYRGRSMLYFEAELRFDILRSGLLGGVVFANMLTFTESPDKNFGDVQPGLGAGLRIKLNKRTHSNAALDFGFGTHNTKGFATNLNEVF